MENQSFIRKNALRGALLIAPVISSMVFASCSDVAGTAAADSMVNFQAPTTGENTTGRDLTISERTYNSETKSFDRPWPFGPEENPQ